MTSHNFRKWVFIGVNVNLRYDNMFREVLRWREGHILALWPRNVLVCCETLVEPLAAQNLFMSDVKPFWQVRGS